MEKRFEVCPADDIGQGERLITELDGFSIGIFNVDGEYFALKNDCPHQRAPLCEGPVTGTTTSDKAGEFEYERPGEIVRCPWHGWEFDIKSGESIFNPHKVKAKSFEATVEEPEDVATDGSGCDGCSVELEGDEPPVETYDVEVEQETVVVYL
ncbi:Rieske (2Fe-2S) protein [Haloarchaeobius amylolyticus]|uniref:Rieske (2Fe-2S) protein n=1 Tax=Haloarchaeobius amylolyticus TaxID=1198296 RepID=UPI00226EC80A|nr:Rieske (2Fe-2S) protein [Haloarchaeobius amylolyticus]